MEARYALTDASDFISLCKAGGTFSVKPGVYEARSHVELFVIISVVLSSAFLGGANVHLIALVTSNRLVDKQAEPKKIVLVGVGQEGDRKMPQAAMR
jgi:hypothetical protein